MLLLLLKRFACPRTLHLLFLESSRSASMHLLPSDPDNCSAKTSSLGSPSIKSSWETLVSRVGGPQARHCRSPGDHCTMHHQRSPPGFHTRVLRCASAYSLVIRCARFRQVIFVDCCSSDADASAQVDMWSCGVVLYAMTMAALPFNGPTEADIVDQITLGMRSVWFIVWRTSSYAATR